MFSGGCTPVNCNTIHKKILKNGIHQAFHGDFPISPYFAPPYVAKKRLARTSLVKAARDAKVFAECCRTLGFWVGNGGFRWVLGMDAFFGVVIMMLLLLFFFAPPQKKKGFNKIEDDDVNASI